MSKIYELFGFAPDQSDPGVNAGRRKAKCPFTEATCDGGGNRHQTKVVLDENPDLANYFDNDLDEVIPGICSLVHGSERWIVCPRRLMGFDHDGNGLPPVNSNLQDHERQTLIAGGLPTGVDLGVWAEVNLSYTANGERTNYKFDFVVAPLLRNKTLQQVQQIHSLTDDQLDKAVSCARKGDLISGRRSPNMTVPVLPDLSHPYVIEVMTASTSGSEKRRRTNISAAFEDAILKDDHEGPGINKRQVWGRMATQLFAKSALAQKWGGKTLWVVQEEFLKEIELTTQLQIEDSQTGGSSTVNFAWLEYKDDSRELESINAKSIQSGLSYTRSKTCADILLSQFPPPKAELLNGILRRGALAARLNL